MNALNRYRQIWKGKSDDFILSKILVDLEKKDKVIKKLTEQNEKLLELINKETKKIEEEVIKEKPSKRNSLFDKLKIKKDG